MLKRFSAPRVPTGEPDVGMKDECLRSVLGRWRIDVTSASLSTSGDWYTNDAACSDEGTEGEGSADDPVSKVTCLPFDVEEVEGLMISIDGPAETNTASSPASKDRSSSSSVV